MERSRPAGPCFGILSPSPSSRSSPEPFGPSPRKDHRDTSPHRSQRPPTLPTERPRPLRGVPPRLRRHELARPLPPLQAAGSRAREAPAHPQRGFAAGAQGTRVSEQGDASSLKHEGSRRLHAHVEHGQVLQRSHGPSEARPPPGRARPRAGRRSNALTLDAHRAAAAACQGNHARWRIPGSVEAWADTLMHMASNLLSDAFT